MIDHDDIQAEENRRREVAVKAGASALATKYEPSPYKDMIKDFVEETSPSVEPEFKELLKNDPKPGYNFVSTPAVALSAEEIVKKNKEAIEQSKTNVSTQNDLLREANENELKVTKTATGEPKVDERGNEVKPIQDAQVSSTPGTKANPSPVGSGDARASNSSTAGENKSGDKKPEAEKK